MDIQNQMIAYRLATRDIRNKYFSPQKWDYPEWDVIELYNNVKKELFRSLVLHPLSLKESSEGKENEGIEVTIANPFAPIMINREIDSGYWDHSCKEVKNSIKMNFIDFLDWNQLGVIDNQFVRVKIKEYKENLDIEGRHALIESRYIKFKKA